MQFTQLGERFFTIGEVLEEVRDEQARKRLAALSLRNVKLEVRVPSKEMIQKTVEFANKTGDFASLSVPDIKLIALARQLHVEARGEEEDVECCEMHLCGWYAGVWRRVLDDLGGGHLELLVDVRGQVLVE